MLISLLKDVTTRVNHRLASSIVLLTFLATVAFARSAARRDIEEYYWTRTRKLYDASVASSPAARGASVATRSASARRRRADMLAREVVFSLCFDNHRRPVVLIVSLQARALWKLHWNF